MVVKLQSWLGMLLLLTLSACQTLDSTKRDPQKRNTQQQDRVWLQDETLFAQRQVDFESQTAWQYTAKVGVVTDQIQEQANIVWNFSDQANSVRLFGPFGVGQIKLEFDQYSVQLSNNDGVLHRGLKSEGMSAEQLLTDITKLPIPINALAYWLFVLPAPDGEYTYQLNEMGQVSVLNQLGWQISFSGYRDYAGNILPRKLTAVRADQTQPVTVKLVTKSWQWPAN